MSGKHRRDAEVMVPVPSDSAPRWLQAILWIILVLIIGLLPVLSLVFQAWNQDKPPQFEELLSRGDLLLLATAISGGCIYDIVMDIIDNWGRGDARNLAIRICLSVGLTALAILSTLEYGAVSVLSAKRSSVDASITTAPGTEVSVVNVAAPPAIGVVLITLALLIITATFGLTAELTKKALKPR